MAFSISKRIYIEFFWLEFEISASEFRPCAKFQLHWTKDKGTQILTWNDTKSGLMTSYLPPNDDVSKIIMVLRDFVPEYYHAKFGCNWTTNKGETGGGAYLVPKDPA